MFFVPSTSRTFSSSYCQTKKTYFWIFKEKRFYLRLYYIRVKKKGVTKCKQTEKHVFPFLVFRSLFLWKLILKHVLLCRPELSINSIHCGSRFLFLKRQKISFFFLVFLKIKRIKNKKKASSPLQLTTNL